MKLTELFTKISYVFKTDIYVLQHKYIVGGSDSNLKNTGTMFCILNEETSELMKREVSEKDFFYIKNIKEAKTDLEDNLVLDILPTTKSGVEENLKSLIKEKNKVKNWGSITLTEDEYDEKTHFLKEKTTYLYTEEELENKLDELLKDIDDFIYNYME